MEYSFHPGAKSELFEAIEYYESCSSGLGLDFAEEIYSSIRQILMFPLAGSPSSRNTRRCLARRFPFGIIYSISEERVFILAIMHLNRKPGYWHKRLKKKT